MERRAAVRWCPRRPLRVAYAEKGSAEHRWALLHDISAGGLGLLVSSAIELGTVLIVQMRSPQQETRSILVRAVHATPHENGNWLVGCRFRPSLTNAELDWVTRQADLPKNWYCPSEP
jgi:hypothetical protein